MELKFAMRIFAAYMCGIGITHTLMSKSYQETNCKPHLKFFLNTKRGSCFSTPIEANTPFIKTKNG